MGAPDRASDGVVPLVGADLARRADAAAEAAGTSRAVLMARAAGHLARTAIEVGGRAYGLRVDIVVGPGDNGGDGWAAAPLLAAAGADVRVVDPAGGPGPRSEAGGAARTAWLAAGGRTVGPPDGEPDAGRHPDVILDCLLGTGATGPLRDGVAAGAARIAAARARGTQVVACDLPTGVDADTGAVVAGAVVADATVTFGALRPGHVLHPGATHAGRVSIGRLGPTHPVVPSGPGRTDAAGPVRLGLLDADGARSRALPADAEKRGRGTVLIVAGRVGASGAAALAARGASAAGAGLVRVAVPAPVRAEVAAHHPAMMVVGLPADADGALHPDAVHALGPHLADVDVVVAGPGLGLGAGAAAVVAALVARPGPLVLDADALNLHRGDPGPLAGHVGPLVLTPHERELARLVPEGGLGSGTPAGRDRCATAVALARALGAVVVAKGPGTVVAGPDGGVLVEPLGTPALATGGTGDVLAGMVGAVLAEAAAPSGVASAGIEPDEAADEAAARASDQAAARAAARAVRWHAVAGRIAAAGGAGRTDALAVAAAVPAALAWAAAAPRPVDRGPAGRVALAELVGSTETSSAAGIPSDTGVMA